MSGYGLFLMLAGIAMAGFTYISVDYAIAEMYVVTVGDAGTDNDFLGLLLHIWDILFVVGVLVIAAIGGIIESLKRRPNEVF